MSHIECCKNCVSPKRHPSCHSKCKDYIREKELHDLEREATRKEKEAYYNSFKRRR